MSIRQAHRKRNLRITRDTVMFAVGISGIIHEALTSGATERPFLLATFCALCGLPVFLRTDEYREAMRKELEK